MVEDAYTVILVDRWGQVLERDGTFYSTNAGHPPFKARFADLDAAREYCDGVVREMPHVECEVCHGGAIVLRHFDAEWQKCEEERVRRVFAEHRAEQRLRGRFALAVLGGLAGSGLVWWLR